MPDSPESSISELLQILRPQVQRKYRLCDHDLDDAQQMTHLELWSRRFPEGVNLPEAYAFQVFRSKAIEVGKARLTTFSRDDAWCRELLAEFPDSTNQERIEALYQARSLLSEKYQSLFDYWVRELKGREITKITCDFGTTSQSVNLHKRAMIEDLRRLMRDLL